MKKKFISLLTSSTIFLNLIIPVNFIRPHKFQELSPKRKLMIGSSLIAGYRFIKNRIYENNNDAGEDTNKWASYTSPNYGYSIKYPQNSKIMNDNPLCVISEDKTFIVSIYASDSPAIYTPEYDGFIEVTEEIKKQLTTTEINGMSLTGNYYFHFIEENKNMEGVSAYTEHNGKYFVLTAHHLYENETPLPDEEIKKRLDRLKNEDFIKTYWEMAGTLEFTD